MDISRLYCLFLCLSFGSFNEGSSNPKKISVAAKLKHITEKLRKENNKNLPPHFEEVDKAAMVNVQLYVSSIDKVDEANMEFTLSGFLHLRWRDERIESKKMDFDYIDLDSEIMKLIWIPDVFFPNEKKGYLHTITAENTMMRLYPDGSILYITRLSMTLGCPMDLQDYPFDRQVCPLYIMSFGYSEEKVGLGWLNCTEDIDHCPGDEVNETGDTIMKDDNIILPQFDLTEIKIANECSIRYHQKQDTHSCLKAEFHLSRNIGFFIVQMYIPSMLIVVLSWISFWLMVNSVPGRISLGLLTVLAMTNWMSSVNATLPRVSYTKAIDVWMSTCLVFVFAALLEFAVVNVLSRKDSLSDLSIKNVFNIPRDPSAPNAIAENKSPYDDPSDKPVKKPRFTKKGIVYAMYLDMAARVVFPLAFITFTIIYWVYYTSKSTP